MSGCQLSVAGGENEKAFAWVRPGTGISAIGRQCRGRILTAGPVPLIAGNQLRRGKSELKRSERLRPNVGREVLTNWDRRDGRRSRLARLHGHNCRHRPLEALRKPGDEPPGKPGGQIRYFRNAPHHPQRLAHNRSRAGDMIGTKRRRHHHNRKNLSSSPHENCDKPTIHRPRRATLIHFAQQSQKRQDQLRPGNCNFIIRAPIPVGLLQFGTYHGERGLFRAAGRRSDNSRASQARANTQSW